MKTVSRMIFCYLLAAFGIAFLVLTVNGALLIGVVLHYGAKGQQEGFFPVGKFAESFTRTDDGFAPAPDMEWQKHFAWAMLLGDDGEILWSENLPEELNHAYTVPEVAAFSRWYLKDYPVMAYRNDFGLLVAGKEQGSMTRFDFYMDNDILYPLLSGVGPLLIVDLCLVAAICLILGWRGAKPLREAAADQLVLLLQITAGLVQLLRQLGGRANWIAGVSHDIRTPLALIMGYGEQLAQQAPPQSEQQKKAAAICTQSQKIKALIEDLNLTFKLQYNAQPLRRTAVPMGAWLRQSVADFCDSLGENYSVGLQIREPAGQTVLEADRELLTRALDNLLNNSVRHNPGGCDIQVAAELADGRFVLTVRDNGAGYPEAILRNLSGTDDPNAPHILGLHLVQQIATAHEGEASFCNDGGAVATLKFAVQESTK